MASEVYLGKTLSIMALEPLLAAGDFSHIEPGDFNQIASEDFSQAKDE